MDTTAIIELHELAKKGAENYPTTRNLLEILRHQSGKHFSGIIGPRGVGKTVLLKQLAASDPNAFYLSLDTVGRTEDIFELLKRLNRDYGYRTFLLDEVHFHTNADAVLKKLYDFLDVRVCFTSSVALALNQSAYDLSRRTLIFPLYPFSFREYLLFKHGKQITPLTMAQIIDKEWLPEHIREGRHFDDYLRGGLMPFALQEPEPLPILERILATVIRKDIPAVARLSIDELDTIQKLVQFIGRSAVDGINYSVLANNLGITKYKAEQYISLLEKAFILQRIFPKGTNVLKEPKVLMALPYRLLFRPYDEALGGLREDFFVESMRMCRQTVFYLKTTRGGKTPDYLMDDGMRENIVIEIGGKGKGRQQFKDVSVDRKIIFTHSDQADTLKRPLFMLGYLSNQKIQDF
jgi:uncharacterized protein